MVMLEISVPMDVKLLDLKDWQWWCWKLNYNSTEQVIFKENVLSQEKDENNDQMSRHLPSLLASIPWGSWWDSEGDKTIFFGHMSTTQSVLGLEYNEIMDFCTVISQLTLLTNSY